MEEQKEVLLESSLEMLKLERSFGELLSYWTHSATHNLDYQNSEKHLQPGKKEKGRQGKRDKFELVVEMKKEKENYCFKWHRSFQGTS